MPLGVVVPRSIEEAERAMLLRARKASAVLPRGGGTSQAGQTVNAALVIDCSKYLNKILDLDVAGARCAVEPGIVLDDLNRQLKPHGLWFPVDISTASRATIGGMAATIPAAGARCATAPRATTSCRSMRCWPTARARISVRIGGDLPICRHSPCGRSRKDLLAIGAREADEMRRGSRTCNAGSAATISMRWRPASNDINLAHLLVGSEGTLAFPRASN